MKAAIFCLVMASFVCSCDKMNNSSKSPNSVSSEVPQGGIIAEEKNQKLKDQFIHFVAVEGKVKENAPIVQEFSQQEILNATLKLYVESVPAGGGSKWVKGNDPRKKEKNIDFENVRAVCLGIEGSQYVFLTLRYFLDFSYPNPNIQGLVDLKLSPSSCPTKVNAEFISYSQMYRIMLSDVRHTGGGQILTRKTISCTLKNDFELSEIGKYDFLSSYSTIGTTKYKDPIKGAVTAHDVVNMQNEIKKGEWAQIETFGNHDVCLIKTDKKLWGDLQLTNLGLENPTETIRFLTERQRHLYGFEFILFSKEAYQAVMHYKVPDEAKQSGIYKLVLFASEIMGVDQVFQIHLLDNLLLHMFKKTTKNSFANFNEVEMAGIALDFGKEFLDYRRKNF